MKECQGELLRPWCQRAHEPRLGSRGGAFHGRGRPSEGRLVPAPRVSSSGSGADRSESDLAPSGDLQIPRQYSGGREGDNPGGLAAAVDELHRSHDLAGQALCDHETVPRGTAARRTRRYAVRLTVPRCSGWRAWGAVRADFEQASPMAANPAIAPAEIASELRRGFKLRAGGPGAHRRCHERGRRAGYRVGRLR